MSDSEGNDANQTCGFRLNDWYVEPASNRIRRNGDSVSLQLLSMQVLVYLSERAGQSVSYDELLDALWPNRVAGEDAVHRRIADLRKSLGDDARRPRFIETIPKRGYRLVATVQQGPEKSAPGSRLPLSIAAVLLVAIVLSAAMINRYPTLPDATETAIINARALIELDDYAGAYLAVRPILDSENDNPRLADTLSEISLPVAIESSPSDAEVFYRLYGQADDEWRRLGVTPFETVLPRSTWSLRFVADGREPVEMALPNPSMTFNNVHRDYYVVKLPRAGEVPDDMVFIPGGNLVVPLLGFRKREDLGEFLIGKTEVSNSEYADFVRDRGYEEPRYWVDLVGNAEDLRFEEVISRFIDSSGAPGPATWIDGYFPVGSEVQPVTGVSWYEAMAYARYRGMTLPTARHWARAALGVDESHWPLARSLLPQAHLEDVGPLDVHSGTAISTWGAINMIGNVREWTVSFSGERKLSLGASYRGPVWNYALPSMENPFQRQPDQGIRLAKYDESIENPPFGNNGEPPKPPQVGADRYADFEEMFRYAVGSFDAETAELVSETVEDDWIRRKILIPTVIPDDPMPVLIFSPKEVVQPLQPVIFFPPGDSYTGGLHSDRIDISGYNIDFVIKSGRALVWPIIIGTHERFRPREVDSPVAFMQRWHRANRFRRDEIGRLLDYFQDSPEFDEDNIGLLAASFGATFVSPHILAAEPRFKSAVLMSASLAGVNTEKVPDHVNPNTYWPNVKLPILVLNGRYDIMLPYGSNRDSLTGLIGTSSNDKKSIYYESSHWPLPTHRVRNDTLQWFDRYLGKPSASTDAYGHRNSSD